MSQDPRFQYVYKVIMRIINRIRHRRCSVKKVFLEISQNSQENTCDRVSFLIKLHATLLKNLLKKRLSHRCFPVNFAKFLRTPFPQNISRQLLCKLLCNFNITLRLGCSPVNLLHIIRTRFPMNTSGEFLPMISVTEIIKNELHN